MCDDFLYHHNVLTHHFLFYHYPFFLKLMASGRAGAALVGV
ncbi:MAG: hypothetical protein ACTFAK_15275 [Candidatus Electronema sp. VV]